MTEFNDLSENELQEVIQNAEKALKEKKVSKRKEVIAQIKDMAASVGLNIEIKDEEGKSPRKGVKVAAKYKNPNNPSQTWTGRGVPPKWMQALIDSGHDKSEFLI